MSFLAGLFPAAAAKAMSGVNAHVFPPDFSLALESGATVNNLTVAYETYGTLNADKSNVILVCHGLTGDQFAAGEHPITGKPGWWTRLIGPGLSIDTDRYFVICPNVLGGCMGGTGPASVNADTKEVWGMSFPVVTIADMVKAQAALLDALGIDKILCVIGGSMGGMQVLQWVKSYRERVISAVPIATSWRHSAQNIAFHEIGRQAVMADPDWRGGEYYKYGVKPVKGLSVARMTAHVTYMSEAALHRKFGRKLQDISDLPYNFDVNFQVESYLRRQGSTFTERFDANCYLYITRALDYFDLTEGANALADVFDGVKTKFCIISFTSDWLFPTSESRHIVRALNATAANVSFVEIDSDKGHDAFLLDEPEMFRIINGFIDAVAREYGI